MCRRYGNFHMLSFLSDLPSLDYFILRFMYGGGEYMIDSVGLESLLAGYGTIS